MWFSADWAPGYWAPDWVLGPIIRGPICHEMLIECWMFKCRIIKCSNVPMFKRSNVPMFQCSNVSISQCSKVQMFECSMVQMFKCQMSNVNYQISIRLDFCRRVPPEFFRSFLLRGFGGSKLKLMMLDPDCVWVWKTATWVKHSIVKHYESWHTPLHSDVNPTGLVL